MPDFDPTQNPANPPPSPPEPCAKPPVKKPKPKKPAQKYTVPDKQLAAYLREQQGKG